MGPVGPVGAMRTVGAMGAVGPVRTMGTMGPVGAVRTVGAVLSATLSATAELPLFVRVVESASRHLLLLAVESRRSVPLERRQFTVVQAIVVVQVVVVLCHYTVPRNQACTQMGAFGELFYPRSAPSVT